MKYTIVDSSEYTYPDMFDYPSSSQTADVMTPRGSYATFQILLNDLPADGKVDVHCNGFNPVLYALYPVYVEANKNLSPEQFTPHCPERIAPYYLYDCLKPFSGSFEVTDGAGGLYVALEISKDADVGIINASIKIADVTIPVKIQVCSAVVPDESLKIIMGYNRSCVAQYHNVEYGSDEFNRLDGEYLKMLRHMRQNMMYVGGVNVNKLCDNKYSFDFTDLEATIDKALSYGFKYFNGPSVGWRKSWHEPTIFVNGNIPSMSYEGYCYLSQYLPALHEMLVRRGWLDIFSMGVADEPNNENATEFRALCGLIRKFVPDIKLIDAMSYGNLHGALDI